MGVPVKVPIAGSLARSVVLRAAAAAFFCGALQLLQDERVWLNLDPPKRLSLIGVVVSIGSMSGLIFRPWWCSMLLTIIFKESSLYSCRRKKTNGALLRRLSARFEL